MTDLVTYQHEFVGDADGKCAVWLETPVPTRAVALRSQCHWPEDDPIHLRQLPADKTES